jgi:hypothetical protein
MDLGFGSLKDVLEVLLVPVSLGLLAVGWPAMSERRRRLNFESLIRRELEEAAPRDPRSTDSPWHAHLTRRFLHEEIIRSAVLQSPGGIAVWTGAHAGARDPVQLAPRSHIEIPRPRGQVHTMSAGVETMGRDH